MKNKKTRWDNFGQEYYKGIWKMKYAEEKLVNKGIVKECLSTQIVNSLTFSDE